ncbi:MAG: hypothetical protein G8D89_21920 [gamma proteobacterium symbiont of Clathrolucina costata]
MMRSIVLLISLVLPISAWCGQQFWNGIVSVERSVPDHISLDEFRAVVVKQLQLQAAAEAGAVIIRTEHLSDGEYKEVIEVASAADVQLSNMKESLDSVDGKLTIRLSADAKVDLTKVSDRVSYLRENKDLRDLLSEMSRHYVSMVTAEQTHAPYSLVWEYQATLSRWFSGGELSALAKHSSAALAQAERDILQEVIAPLIEDGEISAIVESVIDRGDRYEVSIRVSFDFDDTSISQALARYWVIRNRQSVDHPFVLVYGNSPQNAIIPQAMAKDLYERLARKLIVLEVGVGKQKKVIPVAYQGNDFMPGCKVTMPQTQSASYCISKINGETTAGLNTSYFSNPLVLDVPKADIVGRDGIKAITRLLMLDGKKIFPLEPALSLETHH